MPTTSLHRLGALQRACFEPLELRRLLAVSFDPSFGERDGFSVLPLDFEYYLGRDDSNGIAVTTHGFIRAMSQLGSSYFISALYQHHESGTPGDNNTGIVNRTIHVLVDGSGSPRPGLEGDDNDNGVVRYEDVRIGTANHDFKSFKRLERLPDGKLLVSPAYTGPDDTNRRVGASRRMPSLTPTTA